ncbi:YitT family protein [uncultured Duncaniella sp.]|uniref:YitT family protein n=1 Tax=uncultured Duncaniella sp. TaxID=2768039 RepID=UPI0025B7299A|nr:YitT family protein [uncultured Duncaniella sp.]
MSPGFLKYNSLLVNAKDYMSIIFGLSLYALGFTACILPHEVVIGGMAGVSTLVYFGTNGLIPVAVSSYALNLVLLAIAYKIVGRTFVLRTIFGVTVVALAIGVCEGFFMGLGHPLIPDRTVSLVLGAILCGVGVGTCFIHNGSSGGTDIVAACVSKVSNASIGRIMIYTDMLIVSMSIFLPFSGTVEERIEARIPTIVYGIMVTFIVSFITDQIINTNRQATQFFIFSPKWKEIADSILSDAHRGVTVLDGQGWYTKRDVKLLMVYCRKIESVTIFRIIKGIDEDAFVTQGAVNGVYGQGFDKVKIKMKKNESRTHRTDSRLHTALPAASDSPAAKVRRSNSEE